MSAKHTECRSTPGNIIITVLMTFLMMHPGGDASGATPQSTIQYIESDDLSFKQLITEISHQTGYNIELVGEWPSMPLQVSLRAVSLEDGLKHIIKQLGDVSHLLIFDNEERKLKIVALKAGTMPDKPVSEGSGMMPREENINPTSNSVEHGLSERQLAAIKAEYQERIRNQRGETELLPSSEYGPALTQAEFDTIKERYDLALEVDGDSRYVLPPSGDDNGLTATDFEMIKKSYHERLNAEGPDTQILPASANGPALTQGELDAVKQAHSLGKVSRDSIVTPPSSQGPGITMGELEEIKKAYRERHGLDDTGN